MELPLPPPQGRPSHNTGLPAPFAALTSPNPWSVTPFAEKRKWRAVLAGSATRNVIRKQRKTKAERQKDRITVGGMGRHLDGFPAKVNPH